MEVPGRRYEDPFKKQERRSSVEDSQVFCQPCSSDDDWVLAVGYCQNCCEYFCKACLKLHRKQSMSKHHVVLEDENLPREKIMSTTLDSCSEFCSRHTDELLKFYCPSHEEVGCGDCMVLEHKSCGVDRIQDISRNYYNGPEHGELLRKVEQVCEDIKHIDKEMKERNEKRKKSYTKVLGKITAFRKEVKEHFDRAEGEIIADINSRREEDEQQLSQLTEGKQCLEKDVAEMQKKLKLSNKAYDVFVAAKEIKKQMAEIESKVKQMFQLCQIDQYRFNQSSDIENFIAYGISLGNLSECNNMEMNCSEQEDIGNMTISRNLNSSDKPLKHMEPQPDKQLKDIEWQPDKQLVDIESQSDKQLEDIESQSDKQLEDLVSQSDKLLEDIELQSDKQLEDIESQSDKQLEDMEPQFESKILIKDPEDTSECSVLASAIISHRQIVLADCANYCVKLVDIKQKRLVERYSFYSQPKDVTTVCDQSIAVLLPDEMEIQILKIKYSMFIEDRCIKVNAWGGRLLFQGGFFIAAYDDEVNFLDTEGNLKRTIPIESYSTLQSIAVASDFSYFYTSHSSSFRSSVRMYDLHGNYLAQYADNDLKDVKGITVSKSGTVFVCNKGSIHMLSQDLKKIKEVLWNDDNVTSPICISFCNETSKLFLCNQHILYTSQNNFLKVFQMK